MVGKRGADLVDGSGQFELENVIRLHPPAGSAYVELTTIYLTPWFSFIFLFSFYILLNIGCTTDPGDCPIRHPFQLRILIVFMNLSCC